MLAACAVGGSSFALGLFVGVLLAGDEVGRMDGIGFLCVLVLVEVEEHPLGSVDVDLDGARQEPVGDLEGVRRCIEPIAQESIPAGPL